MHTFSQQDFVVSFCAGTVPHAGDMAVSKPNPVFTFTESIWWWERESSGVISAMKQINRVTKYIALKKRGKPTLDKTSVK